MFQAFACPACPAQPGSHLHDPYDPYDPYGRHDPYGRMSEPPAARACTGGRIRTVHGGTTEIMKETVGRFLPG